MRRLSNVCNIIISIHVWIDLCVIFYGTAQYNSCCFVVVKKSKNYNAMVSRQNIWMFFIVWIYCSNFDIFTIFSKLCGLDKKCILRLISKPDRLAQWLLGGWVVWS